MGYKILIDSCGEIPQSLRSTGVVENIPLSIMVEDETIIDDETFDQKSFLEKVAKSKNCPKSACPSPEGYMKAFECEADRIYVITLSSKLSGSYNSAVLGKNLYEEEYSDKQIVVFDSKSASVGQTLIAMKIVEAEEAGLSFEEVIAKAEQFREEENTYFVLESLETLRKNGRLSNLKALAADVLNIKPVMGSDSDGNIVQLDKARGMKKALDKMVTQMFKNAGNTEEKVLAISHCNCPERAEWVKELALSKGRFKDCFVVDTRGISSLYANDGGIIMVV